MYSCPHCMDLEGFLQDWEDNLDPNVRFERIPAIYPASVCAVVQGHKLAYLGAWLLRSSSPCGLNAARWATECLSSSAR